MQQRRITKDDVEWALTHQTGLPFPGEPGSLWIIGYAAGGRILKVCVAAEDTNHVITAVWRGP
jgi:hypothetical protein